MWKCNSKVQYSKHKYCTLQQVFDTANRDTINVVSLAKGLIFVRRFSGFVSLRIFLNYAHVTKWVNVQIWSLSRYVKIRVPPALICQPQTPSPSLAIIILLLAVEPLQLLTEPPQYYRSQLSYHYTAHSFSQLSHNITSSPNSNCSTTPHSSWCHTAKTQYQKF
jgi:hypothetical protein